MEKNMIIMLNDINYTIIKLVDLLDELFEEYEKLVKF